MANRQKVTPLNPVLSSEQGAIIQRANAAPQTPVPAPTSLADLQAQLAAARAENERLKAQAKKPTQARSLTLSVSQKGALSVYGIGRFPVTLYREQWERLLAIAQEITDFIAENDSALAKKNRDND